MRSLGWVLIQSDECPSKERLGHRHTQRRDQMKTLGKTATYKPKKKASKETDLADSLIFFFLTSSPQNYERTCEHISLV